MKILLISLLSTLSLLIPATTLLTAAEDINPSENPLVGACNQADGQSDTASELCKESAGDSDQVGDGSLLTSIVNLLAFVAGAIGVIVIVISGITMITSNGDAAKIKTSRDTIIFTAVGLVVVVAARTIITFVIEQI